MPMFAYYFKEFIPGNNITLGGKLFSLYIDASIVDGQNSGSRIRTETDIWAHSACRCRRNTLLDNIQRLLHQFYQ